MDRIAVASFISTSISEITGWSIPMSESDRLDDLPLDSLQCIELTAAVEDRFGISISCSQRVSIETLGDFADLVLDSPPLLLQAA